MSAIYFLKNDSDNPIPGIDPDTKKELPLPRFNANDGYRFKPGEVMALTEEEALHLLNTQPQLKLVTKHGQEGGGLDVQSIFGTAKALETFGLSPAEERELSEREDATEERKSRGKGAKR